MRPADVCGCSRKPSVVSSAISLRMVAEEKSMSGSAAIVLEPTGSARADVEVHNGLQDLLFALGKLHGFDLLVFL